MTDRQYFPKMKIELEAIKGFLDRLYHRHDPSELILELVRASTVVSEYRGFALIPVEARSSLVCRNP